MIWHIPDWEYLVRAHASGGVVIVRDPLARSSLKRAGLMEPSPSTRNSFGYLNPKMMRLTKKGQRRAQELWGQFYDGNSAAARVLKRDRNRLVNKNGTERRSSPALWLGVWV